MSRTRSKSNAQIAHDNELAILRAIRLFGHLRRVEIARACWPDSSAESASACAWRTIARMIKNGDIVERANNLGGQSLMLTKRGANRLLDIGLEAPLSLDATAPALQQFWHRTLATRYLIERIEPGAGVLGEYALYQSWSPIKREHLAVRYKKLPDGLVFVRGASRGYNTPGQRAVDWIEVESADKATRELTNIFEVTKYAEQLLPYQADIVLDRVCIVYDASATHEYRILSALQQFLQRNPGIEDSVSHNLYLVRCYVRRPLIWERFEQIPCAALLRDFRRTGRTEIMAPPEEPLSGQLRANQ